MTALPVTIGAIVAAGILWSCGATQGFETEPLPSSLAADWAKQLSPTSSFATELRWRLETPSGRAVGRATLRFFSADSLRIDYRAPFGRRGSAVVTPSRVVWADSEDVLRFVPTIRLFWSALGVPVRGPASARTTAATHTAATREWRVEFGDTTVVYRHTIQPDRSTFTTLMLDRDVVMGTAFAELSAVPGAPTRGRIVLPGRTLFTASTTAVHSVSGGNDSHR